jgi:hypothetical protein
MATSESNMNVANLRRTAAVTVTRSNALCLCDSVLLASPDCRRGRS